MLHSTVSLKYPYISLANLRNLTWTERSYMRICFREIIYGLQLCRSYKFKNDEFFTKAFKPEVYFIWIKSVTFNFNQLSVAFFKIRHVREADFQDDEVLCPGLRLFSKLMSF